MGHGHGHAHRAAAGIDEEVRVGGVARTALLAVLGVVLVATVVGLFVWWPDGDVAAERAESGGPAAQFAADGVTFPLAEVVEVTDPCPETGMPDGSGCSTLRVDVGEGPDGGIVAVPVPPEVLESGIEAGDRVELLRTPPAEEGGEASYSYFATDRDGTLLWLTALFVLVVLAIARLRGLFALFGLAFGAAVVWWFVLPALLGGAPGVAIAIVGSTAIMYVVLYTTHGFSLRTSTALAGTLVGILITAGLGVVVVGRARLTGISDEAGTILHSFGSDLGFQSLFSCALVIAGLGVLNDVTITQASAVWELRAASPTASRREVFASAMRIGRDHVASTIYTIVFAYVGTALVLLMLLQVYGRPLIDLLSTEQLAEEVVRTLTTSIGLVLAVPLTTGLAALVAAPRSATD